MYRLSAFTLGKGETFTSANVYPHFSGKIFHRDAQLDLRP